MRSSPSVASSGRPGPPTAGTPDPHDGHDQHINPRDLLAWRLTSSCVADRVCPGWTACRRDRVRPPLILFGFLSQISKTRAVAVVGSVPQDQAVDQDEVAARRDDLVRFREVFYGCLPTRADAQFELTEALLCVDGPVRSLVDLSLAPEHRRGHGALYAGLNDGSIEIARLRRGLAGLPLPRIGERIVLAADVSPWLRPDAQTSPQRLFCHVHGRAKGTAQMIPGWPYSVVAALGSGRSSWTAVLDAVRVGPADDTPAVTAGSCGRWWTGCARRGTGSLVTHSCGSCSTPATTCADWRSCSPICRSCWSGGCARTGYWPARCTPAPAAPEVVPAATARCWSWPTRPAGPSPNTPPAPTPPATAPRRPLPGSAATPAWNTAAPGATIPGRRLSSRAP